MSTNFVQELEEHCRSHSRPKPVYHIEPPNQPNGEFLAIITNSVVIGGGGGSPKMGTTAEEAKNKAAQSLLEMIRDNNTVDTLVVATQRLNIQTPTNASSRHSSEEIDDEVSKIPNPIGYLNEYCSKKRLSQPHYEIVQRHGEPHNPLFVVECTLEVKGDNLVSHGKGCPKQKAKERAAQEMIRKLRNSESEPKNTSNISLNCDLTSYFSHKFRTNAEVDQCFTDNSIDVNQRLETLAQLLGCRIQYDSSTTLVVLKVIIQELNFPLLATSAANRTMAARKAVNMLRVSLQ